MTEDENQKWAFKTNEVPDNNSNFQIFKNGQLKQNPEKNSIINLQKDSIINKNMNLEQKLKLASPKAKITAYQTRNQKSNLELQNSQGNFISQLNTKNNNASKGKTFKKKNITLNDNSIKDNSVSRNKIPFKFISNIGMASKNEELLTYNGNITNVNNFNSKLKGNQIKGKKEKSPNITLYKEKPTVILGKNMNNKDVDTRSTEEKKQLPDRTNYYFSAIGSDEVGTGDYFYPIVVSACFMDKENIKYLESLGVHDSKKLTDEKITRIAPLILKKIPCESIILSNKEYNEYHDQGINMNKMKAIMHNKVLYKMKSKGYKYSKIIVDQFAKDYSYFGYLRNIPEIPNEHNFAKTIDKKAE